jgi:hypothetical protein
MCRAELYPTGEKDLADQEVFLGEVKNVLNQLAPLSQRGARMRPYGDTTIGGSIGLTTYCFEKICMEFTFEVKPGLDSFEGPETTFELQNPSARKNKDLGKGEIDFTDLPKSVLGVRIEWRQRTCSN